MMTVEILVYLHHSGIYLMSCHIPYTYPSPYHHYNLGDHYLHYFDTRDTLVWIWECEYSPRCDVNSDQSLHDALKLAMTMTMLRELMHLE